MNLELSNANAVIVARQFNPSITNQVWLVDNGLIRREDFRPGCIFTDALVNVATEKFALIVSPELVQFAPNDAVGSPQSLATETLGRLIELLPHTPFAAAGLNFTWHFTPTLDAGNWSRKMFFQNQLPFREFDVADARFGGYLSRNALGCRLKLDVKPITVTNLDNSEQTIEFFQFHFNYNSDIKKGVGAVQKIRELIGKWDEAKAMATQIMERIGEEAA